MGAINFQTPRAHPIVHWVGSHSRKRPRSVNGRCSQGAAFSVERRVGAQKYLLRRPSWFSSWLLLSVTCSPRVSVSLCVWTWLPLETFLFPTPSHPPPSLGWYFAGFHPPAPWVPAVLRRWHSLDPGGLKLSPQQVFFTNELLPT